LGYSVCPIDLHSAIIEITTVVLESKDESVVSRGLLKKNKYTKKKLVTV
jgi:hypothetical protein